MKRKVIPLFLTLSVCGTFSSHMDLKAAASYTNFQQEGIIVEGTVVNSSTGKVLQGVTIIVKASGKSTKTDAEGRYRIEIPYKDALLTFSYVGFQPQQIIAGGRTTLQVSLV